MTAEPKIKLLETAKADDLATNDQAATTEQLDAEEAEFRTIRRDLPGVKGASAVGIVTISVGKTPTKNEFFRTHPEFRPIVPIVNLEVGMEKQFFAVTADMVSNLSGIGITVTDHTLYLTSHIARRRPRRAGAPGQRRRRAERIRSHQGNRADAELSTSGFACSPTRKTTAMRSFPRRPDVSANRNGRSLKPAKIFKLAFRDKGRLIDSIEHPLFQEVGGP